MEDILKYVMETPGNTNYAVLKSMLESLPSSGGGGGSSLTDIVVHFKATESYDSDANLTTYEVVDSDYTPDEFNEAI